MAYNADSVRSTIRSQIRQLSSGPAGRSPTYSPATTSNPSSALLPLTPKQSSQRSREEKKQQQQQQQQQPQKWRPSMSLALNNSQQQHPLQEAESEGSRHLQSEQGGTVVVHGEIAPKQNNIEQEEKEKAIREKERKLVPLSKSDRHPAAATPGDVGGRGDTMAATATGGYRRSSTSTTYSTRESSPELSFKLDSSSSNSNNTSKSVSPIPPPFFPSSSSSSSGVVGCLSSERVRTPVPADSPLLGTKPPAPANQSLQVGIISPSTLSSFVKMNRGVITYSYNV